MTASDPLVVVDLFCGAGGFSSGAALALEELGHTPGEDVELHAINHWGVAIETHEANHPWATHYHSDVDDVDPEAIAEPGEVELMAGGPECTHYSTARGGKPVSDQKREPAFNVLTWVQKLRPDNVLIENVEEFRKWGKIDEDGQPTKDGEIFDVWIHALNAMGYAVDHRVLNAADYGDPTSRNRLFIIARREGRPTFPAPTHSDDPEDDLADWRPAAEIIDWSDPGTSLWTRDLEEPRAKQLKFTTMRRIAEGIRRHCDDRLEPFADALDWIGRVDEKDIERHGVDPDNFLSVEDLRQRVVPAEQAHLVAEALDEPFLVAAPERVPTWDSPYLLGQHSTNQARSVDVPAPTVTTVPRVGLSAPGTYVIGQQSNAIARDVQERPMPTVAKQGNVHCFEPRAYCLRQQSGGIPAPIEDPLPTVSGGGAIGLAEVHGRPLVKPKNGISRGLHSNALYPPEEQPFHTVTTDPRAAVLQPSLVRYSHKGASLDVDEPVPTITTAKGGVFALANPYLTPLYQERARQAPRTRGLCRPLMTVPASKTPAGLACPFIDDFEGPPKRPAVPLGTITSRDRFALCVPELYPLGLDVKYRMLKPAELKQAQGFPADYHLAGERKRDVTEQIGNAVPVNTAKALCRHLLAASDPDLSTYGGGLAEDSDYEPPSYAEVSSSDD